MTLPPVEQTGNVEHADLGPGRGGRRGGADSGPGAGPDRRGGRRRPQRVGKDAPGHRRRRRPSTARSCTSTRSTRGGTVSRPGVDLATTYVLEPLARGERAAYPRWDWMRSRPGRTIPVDAGTHLVLEGCGALVPPAAGYAAVRVWVDAPTEVRKAACAVARRRDLRAALGALGRPGGRRLRRRAPVGATPTSCCARWPREPRRPAPRGGAPARPVAHPVGLPRADRCRGARRVARGQQGARTRQPVLRPGDGDPLPRAHLRPAAAAHRRGHRRGRRSACSSGTSSCTVLGSGAVADGRRRRAGDGHRHRRVVGAAARDPGRGAVGVHRGARRHPERGLLALARRGRRRPGGARHRRRRTHLTGTPTPAEAARTVRAIASTLRDVVAGAAARRPGARVRGAGRRPVDRGPAR